LNQSEKQETVVLLKKKLSDNTFVTLLDYKGLNVAEISSLRHELRDADAEFRVLKNTLAKIAIQGTAAQTLEEYFSGPTAVTLTSQDPVAPAKILTRFAKENPKLEFKAGLLHGKPLSEQNLQELSKLPSREIILSTLLGTLKSPPSGLVNVLSGIMRKLLGTLLAIEQKKSDTSSS